MSENKNEPNEKQDMGNAVVNGSCSSALRDILGALLIVGLVIHALLS